MRLGRLVVVSLATCLVAMAAAASSWAGKAADSGLLLLDPTTLDRVVAAGAIEDARQLAGDKTKAKATRAGKKSEKSLKKRQKGSKKGTASPVVLPAGSSLGIPSVGADRNPIVGVVEPVLEPPPVLVVTPPSPDPTLEGSTEIKASGAASYRATGTTKNYRQTLLVSGSASR